MTKWTIFSSFFVSFVLTSLRGVGEPVEVFRRVNLATVEHVGAHLRPVLLVHALFVVSALAVGVLGVLVDGSQGRGRPLVVESPTTGNIFLADRLIVSNRVLYASERSSGILNCSGPGVRMSDGEHGHHDGHGQGEELDIDLHFEFGERFTFLICSH